MFSTLTSKEPYTQHILRGSNQDGDVDLVGSGYWSYRTQRLASRKARQLTGEELHGYMATLLKNLTQLPADQSSPLTTLRLEKWNWQLPDEPLHPIQVSLMEVPKR